MKRPRCCPEPRCTPINQEGEPHSDDPGDSWLCLGKLDEPVQFIYGGNEHTNDLSACTYTPLKGVIRFLENADDWLLNAHAYMIALWELGGRSEPCPRPPWALHRAAKR